jgi:hypothetical protein
MCTGEERSRDTEKDVKLRFDLLFWSVRIGHQLIRIFQTNRHQQRWEVHDTNPDTAKNGERELSTLCLFVWGNLVLNSLLRGISVFVRNYLSA